MIVAYGCTGAVVACLEARNWRRGVYGGVEPTWPRALAWGAVLGAAWPVLAVAALALRVAAVR